MKTIHAILFFMLLLLSCNRSTVRMNDYAVHGIDVSHHQSYINWPLISDQKIDFAFAKATEGLHFQDSLFCHNWASMQSVGIIRGAYHFFRPSLDPLLQAENFCQLVELEEGDLPPVLDVEVLDNTAIPELLHKMTIWLTHVESQLGIRPIIYTNQKFFNNYLAGRFDTYPIWIARYNPFFQPNLHAEQDWLFWQYGNRGRLNGINGDVDFNVFRGTLQELKEMCLAKGSLVHWL